MHHNFVGPPKTTHTHTHTPMYSHTHIHTFTHMGIVSVI